MTVEDYLKNHCKVDLSHIASKMWPTNKNASAYLSRKLNNADGRSFTKKDSEKALLALKELSIELNNLTID
ncbi:hypothetical protein [Chryseobacterium sp.]|uniref:hypothetical protein n=1 Tax=Chryseobacterium sp. TaxID=1871047 RepID=UPI00289CE42D|nr:hypothetical protein [Chryseobacterium sp.]